MRLLNEMRDVGGGRGNLYPLCHHVVVVHCRERIRTELSADGFRRHRHLRRRRREHLSIYLSVRACVRRARVFECVDSFTAAHPFQNDGRGGSI